MTLDTVTPAAADASLNLDNRVK